jgi:hypothetical protein
VLRDQGLGDFRMHDPSWCLRQMLRVDNEYDVS